MAIELTRNEKGEIIAIDKENKKEVGSVTTMGDEIKKDIIVSE